MQALGTCGGSDEIKNNTHPKNITALFREQANVTSAVVAPTLTLQQGVVAAPTLTLQEGVVAAPILVGTPVVLSAAAPPPT